jgi:large subunit ribosomal protein L22
MEIKAKAKNIKSSSRKMRLVIDVVRGMKIEAAVNQLQFMNKKAAKPVMKLVKSATANAVNNFELEESNLYIKTIRVDEGKTMKRWLPRARGRATPLRKRSCHIILLLDELVDSGKKGAKKQKIEAPIKLDTKDVDKKTEAGDAKLAKKDVKNVSKSMKGKGTEQKKSAGMFRRKSG